MSSQFKAINLIEGERIAQITREGYSVTHDDAHTDRQLAICAACYAVAHVGDDVKVTKPFEGIMEDCRDAWPFDGCADKRAKHCEIRCLVIAGALIAAEIDRLLRIGVNK